MTTTFDPTLAMASTGELPPNRQEPAACAAPEMAAKAQAALDQVTRQASDIFERRPLVVLAAAAGAGAVAAWLIRR